MEPKEIVKQALPIMTLEVVDQLRELKLDSPLTRLRFWYYDTSAPTCYLLGDVLTLQARDHILKTEQYPGEVIWNQVVQTEYEIGVGLAEGSPCEPLFQQAYDLMNEIKMSRLLCHALSMNLNRLDWSSIQSVTDDFIVYAQNGTDRGCDCYDDLVESVPNEKLELLHSRGLLGTGEDYDSLPSN